MKILKYAVVFFITAALLLFTACAAEGDYGFYDRTEDGEIGTVDVLLMLNDVLNNEESDATLVHVLRSLKASVSSVSVDVFIKKVDYETEAVTLFYMDEEFAMTFEQLGLHKVDFIDLYEEGYAKLVILHSEPKDFFKNFDATKVYAVKLDYRYDTSILECTVGSTRATLNGEEITLIVAPFSENGVPMIDSCVFNDYFEAEMQEGEVVCVKDIADELEMKYLFDEKSGTLTLIRQFYPTIVVESTSGSAGGDVTVNVTVKHNPGFAGIEYRVKYTSSFASYVSAKSNTNSLFSQFSPNAGTNPVKAVFANLSLKNVSGDLSLASFTFKLADNASGEKTFSISDVSAYDATIIQLKTTVVNGTVTVE